MLGKTLIIRLTVLLVVFSACVSSVLLAFMLYQGEGAAQVSFVLLYTLVSFLALGCFLYLFIRQDVIVPMQEIIDVINRVTDGEVDVKMKQYPKNEIGMLAWSFNRMMSRFEHLTYSRNFIAHIILDISDGIIILDKNKSEIWF